jgi:hypothetical protein
MRRSHASSAANFIPIGGDVTTESPWRDSRKTASRARFDERSRR